MGVRESLDNEVCNFLVRKLKVSMSSTDCRTTVGQHNNIVWSSEQLCTLFWDVSLVCFPQVLFQILKVLSVGFCFGNTCSF